MSRSTTIAFAAIALFLVLFPLSLSKPGLPLTLKSDEPAYYLMALSLAHDRDLVCAVEDIQRLGVEFPYNDAKNLILGSSDGWKTVYFGKPYLVSLLAALPVAVAGANGFVAMNMALLLLSAWLGALWLRQWNGDTTSLLFSTGFFLLSNAFAYVFWLHTEVLCVASTTAALYLGLTAPSARPAMSRLARLLSRFRTSGFRLALSGAALVLGAYNKPYLALLALPVVVGAFRKHGLRGPLAWAAGFGAAMLAVCGVSIALIGKPTPYLGFARVGVNVDYFDRMPDLPIPRSTDPSGVSDDEKAAAAAADAIVPDTTAVVAAPADGAAAVPETATAPAAPAAPSDDAVNSFSWIFASFKLDANTLPNLGYFFVGRHTGLFPYAPFSLLALLLFLFRGPRDLERWLLLASLLGIALYSITFIWFNWHGGGGFVGNRYFVNALPGFLFLAGRIAPAWLPLVGYALGGLFVGGIVFTPFGANVEAPTLQAHTRNLPFRFLPFEHSIDPLIPGYRGLPGGAGSFLSGRADLFRPIGDALWVVGGQRVELELKTPAPIVRPVFEVRTFIAPNRVRVELGGAHQEIDFESAEPPANVTRIVLDHPKPQSRLVWSGERITVYDLAVRADRQVWRTEEVMFRESKKGPRSKQPTPPPVGLPDWEKNEIRALVGASISFLGEEAELQADIYDVGWVRAPIPPSWPAGRMTATTIRLKNQSSTVWRANGATAVAVSYHWLRTDDSRVVWEGLRTPLPKDVEPGEEVEVLLEVETPKERGLYRLALDLVREKIAWFSERRENQSSVHVVEIVPPEG